MSKVKRFVVAVLIIISLCGLIYGIYDEKQKQDRIFANIERKINNNKKLILQLMSHIVAVELYANELYAYQRCFLDGKQAILNDNDLFLLVNNTIPSIKESIDIIVKNGEFEHVPIEPFKIWGNKNKEKYYRLKSELDEINNYIMVIHYSATKLYASSEDLKNILSKNAKKITS